MRQLKVHAHWEIRPPRAPYVEPREVVNYIGRSPGGFIGGNLVLRVLPWDGIGYRCVLDGSNAVGVYSKQIEYYDHDLVNFNKEVPPKFWHNSKHRHLFPNLHTYIRMIRFGESISEAIQSLNLTSAKYSAEVYERRHMENLGISPIPRIGGAA